MRCKRVLCWAYFGCSRMLRQAISLTSFAKPNAKGKGSDRVPFSFGEPITHKSSDVFVLTFMWCDDNGIFNCNLIDLLLGRVELF